MADPKLSERPSIDMAGAVWPWSREDGERFIAEARALEASLAAERERADAAERDRNWSRCEKERLQSLLDSALPERDRLKAILGESTECACGCPVAEHENYGEDGESCGNGDHACVRVPPVVAGWLATLREVLAAQRDRLEEAERRLDLSAAKLAEAEAHQAAAEGNWRIVLDERDAALAKLAEAEAANARAMREAVEVALRLMRAMEEHAQRFETAMCSTPAPSVPGAVRAPSIESAASAVVCDKCGGRPPLNYNGYKCDKWDALSAEQCPGTFVRAVPGGEGRP